MYGIYGLREVITICENVLRVIGFPEKYSKILYFSLFLVLSSFPPYSLQASEMYGQLLVNKIRKHTHRV